ncbi:MAG: hypothetical protein RBS78_00920 [Coriobacteriia bacterium]|jgi:hypothetical protein|nr:hypothetical protein [Coriobacteriia bacterium]
MYSTGSTKPLRIAEYARTSLVDPPTVAEMEARGFRIQCGVWVKRRPKAHDYKFARRIAVGFLQAAIGE